MECIILCGGQGKRLGTDLPKALVQIDDDTLIDKRIKYLISQGVTHFVLAIGYKKELIINYITKKYKDIMIDFAEEEHPLGTGGAIKNAMQYINNDWCFVTNCDDITNINLKKFSNDVYNCDAIVLTQFYSPYGIVEVKNNVVSNFIEKPLLKDLWCSCGFYLLSKTLLYNFPEKFSIEVDVFPKIHLLAFKHLGYWITINTPKDLEDAKKKIQTI